MINFNENRLVVESKIDLLQPILYKSPVLLIPKKQPVVKSGFRYLCWFNKSRKGRPKVLFYGPLQPADKPPPPTLLCLYGQYDGHIILKVNNFIFTRENYRIIFERPLWYLNKSITESSPLLAQRFVSSCVTAVIHAYFQDLVTESEVMNLQRELEKIEAIAARTESKYKSESETSFKFLNKLGSKFLNRLQQILKGG